jgi:hypothetical protein
MAGASPGGGSTRAQHGSGKQASGPPPGRVRRGRAAWAIAVALLSWGAPPRAGAAVPDGLGGFVEVAVGLGEDGFSAVAVDGRDPSRYWAASGARVIESRDGGRTWTDLVRLPGDGAGAAGVAGEEIADDVEKEALAAGLDDEDPEAGDFAAEPVEGGETPFPGATVPAADGNRILGLRSGPDGLWIAASEGAYRLSLPAEGDSPQGSAPGPGAEGTLERFALPGGARVRAVAPDPLRARSAWLATSTGLFRIEEGQLLRVAGEVGRTPARDVDAVVGEDGAMVAVASDDGLFLSRDGGLSFAGPVAVGPAGGAVAAVRFSPDGAAIAVSPGGVVVRLASRGQGEVRIVTGLGRDVRRLHLAGGVGWLVTADGPFRWSLPREWSPGGAMEGAEAAPVLAGLPAAAIDVASPRDRADRLLVGSDRGLFLWAMPDLEDRDLPAAPGEPALPGHPVAVALLASRAEAHLGLRTLDAWKRIALAPLLPRVDLSWTEVPGDGGARDAWAVVARWDLARLLGADGTAASAVERRLHRTRRSLALRIERAVRARNRLVRAGVAATTPVDAALAVLDRDEQSARIAGLTGGPLPGDPGAGGGGIGAAGGWHGGAGGPADGTGRAGFPGRAR